MGSDFHIDYSAYKDWMFCKWFWYEKYVNKMQRKPFTQRSDNLALGSLVHSGLENWHRRGVPEIAMSVINDTNPTPETLAMAQAVMMAYVKKYPTEPWVPVALEKPLVREYSWGRLVAKLDGYTVLDHVVEIPDGVNGGVITLNPGLYGIEHKTKAERINRADYMARWLVNKQADFQLLALSAKEPGASIYNLSGTPVQGIIVNVIDKPAIYVPKRKCKQCDKQYDLAAWIPAGENGWSCPECGNVQKLKAPKVNGDVGEKFDFWRIVAKRTEEQLAKTEMEIEYVAMDMIGMIEGGMTDYHVPNRENCISPFNYHRCQYFEPHLTGMSTIGHPEYEPTRDYLGITE